MKLNISKPCEENWLAMTPNNQGKLCQKCDKTVVDFTQFNDFEVLEYLKNSSKICGRFNDSQLNRELGKQAINTSKWAAAACSIIMLNVETVLAQNEIVTSIHDSAVNNQVINLAYPNSVIILRVTQPDDKEEWITSLKVQIDSFSIDCKVDSTETLTISTPNKYIDASAIVTLRNTKGDTFTIEIIRNTIFNSTIWNSSNQFNFLFNGENWSYIKPFIYRPETITMGILPIEYEFKKFPEISWLNIYPINIAYSITDSIKKGKDSAKKQNSDSSLNSNLIPQKVKEVKTKKGFGIQAGIIASVGLLITFLVLIWRKFSKKYKA